MQIQPSQCGFTLIELMIALVVGLIVSGAAVALVAAIGKSNADTVRATRLTQELRATAEVIARDMRRARSNYDPIEIVGRTSVAGMKACDTITIGTITTAGDCIKYAYACEADSTGTFQKGTFNSIGLVGTKVYLNQSTAAAAACPASGDGTSVQISSSTVNIDQLTFSTVAGGAFRVFLKGELAYEPGVTNSVTITKPIRTISQDIRIRSASVP